MKCFAQSNPQSFIQAMLNSTSAFWLCCYIWQLLATLSGTHAFFSESMQRINPQACWSVTASISRSGMELIFHETAQNIAALNAARLSQPLGDHVQPRTQGFCPKPSTPAPALSWDQPSICCSCCVATRPMWPQGIACSNKLNLTLLEWNTNYSGMLWGFF